ncbi:uncharacterized protein LOC142046878 [Chelonoidis abingdonii]|uniref:uncharacterized protein LOC142046878 n=1 Tax=Chelonoidis abingdonii TaxID=106734 RepID=UPI003F493D6C
MPKDSADGEEEEDEDEGELAESTQHSVLPNSQNLFLSLTEVPSQPSQGGIPDHEAMEGISAANSASLPPPFRRLSQIRWRKKKMRDEMFSEIMEVTHNEKAHLNKWKDMVSKHKKDASDCEERRDEREERRDEREERRDTQDERRDARDEWWQDATLGLLRDQTDVLRRLVELQERQQDHRVPLQPLYNHLPPSLCSLASSPRRVIMRRGRLCASVHSTPVNSPAKRLSFF